jgi:hypothetical protein
MPTMAEALQRQINVHDPYFNRGTMLPFGERTFPNNPHSRTEFAVPGAIYDPVMLGAKSMQQALSGQRVNPDDVTRLSLDLGMLGAPVGMAAAPAGALAMGGARKAASRLPMDHASRMARADEMFPIDAYHGTNENIIEFSNAARGGSTKAQSAKKAHWFIDDPSSASGYAELAGQKKVDDLINASQQAERVGDWDAAHELMVKAEKLDQVSGRGENVMPVRLGGKLKEIDMDGIQYDPDDVNLSAILDEAKLEGYDGVKFLDFSDEAGYGVYNPATHYAIFNPVNIRSKYAKFDPAKKDSADLLAANPATAAIPGLLPHQDDRKARMQNALMGNR